MLIKTPDNNFSVFKAHEDERYHHLIGAFKKPDTGMLIVIKDLLVEKGIVCDDTNTIFIGDAWQDMKAAHGAALPFLHANHVHSMKRDKDCWKQAISGNCAVQEKSQQGINMDDQIVLYQNLLGLQGTTFSPIQHEDATVAIVYTVTMSDGTQSILKVCTRDNDFFRELYYLTFFADTLKVPRIIKTVQPKAGVAGALLMECLPGSVLKMADITHELAYDIGAMLAQIHSNRTAGYGDLTQPQTIILDPRSYFSIKFNEGLSECSNHLPQTLLAKCRAYYDAHLNLLDLADGPCIVHRDFRPGNIIAFDGKLQGVIDWSSARAGFAQEDFLPDGT